MTQPSPPRVLIVTTSFPLSPASASGVFIKRLADALHPDARVTVLTPDGCDEDSLAHCPYPVIPVRYAARHRQTLTHLPGGIPASVRARKRNWLLMPLLFGALFVSTLARARRFDVIHANWSLTGLICAIAGRITGTPTVVTLRGSDVSRLSGSRGQRIVCSLVLRLARHVVTVSESMRSDLIHVFPRHAFKITHIPNGVNDSLLRLPLVPPTSPSFRLLYIGNLIRNKGVHELIEALNGTSRSFSLTVVGDGPERATLELTAKQFGGERSICFTGSIPPDEIGTIMARHDALILPSHAEGRPNVVVEAMAAGRVVIASDLPGITELIKSGHNGLLVPVGDIPALRAAIQSLAEDPARCAAIAANARATILDLGLDWHHCAERYLALYAEVRGD